MGNNICEIVDTLHPLSEDEKMGTQISLLQNQEVNTNFIVNLEERLSYILGTEPLSTISEKHSPDTTNINWTTKLVGNELEIIRFK